MSAPRATLSSPDDASLSGEVSDGEEGLGRRAAANGAVANGAVGSEASAKEEVLAADGGHGAPRDTRGRKPLPWWLALFAPVALLLLWDALVRFEVFQPYQLPFPSTVLQTLWSMAVAGELHEHILITLQRVALGFSFGTAAAVALGGLVGLSRVADRMLDGTLQALRNIPSLAWVPLFILWFGVGEVSKVTLIALGTFFPVYLNLVDAIQNIDRKLIEVGRVHGLGRWAMARRIILPATLPGLLVGIRGGIGLGWMFVVAAELIAASQGLGFLMSDGRVMARPDIVIASILLFALFGQLSDLLVKKIQDVVLDWQDRATI